MLIVVTSTLWDRRHHRQSGTATTVTSGRGLRDTVAAASLESIEVESKTRAMHRGENYGDLGKR